MSVWCKTSAPTRRLVLVREAFCTHFSFGTKLRPSRPPMSSTSGVVNGMDAQRAPESLRRVRVSSRVHSFFVVACMSLQISAVLLSLSLLSSAGTPCTPPLVAGLGEDALAFARTQFDYVVIGGFTRIQKCCPHVMLFRRRDSWHGAGIEVK